MAIRQLRQCGRLVYWHRPNFGRFEFEPTEDALRKILPWETSFIIERSGSLEERLYLLSMEVAEENEAGSSLRYRYGTDLDVMFLPQLAIIKEITVSDEEENSADESISDVVAFIENAKEPRYVKLRVNTACRWSLPDDVLESKGDCVYVSSSKFCDVFRKNLNQVQEVAKAAGPSLLVTEHLVQEAGISMESVDLVFAFRCPNWPSVADEWAKRKRNWPQPEIVQMIFHQGCAAVAKGFGDASHLEWRLSFSFAETVLAQNLNPVQRKCYLVVKGLVKDLHYERIPSYWVKCAFFWFLEEADPDIWNNLNLGHCVLGVIERLTKCLQSYTLPNYFVIQRNHLKEISKESCAIISKELMQIMQKPLLALANSPKLTKCIESLLSQAPEKFGYSTLLALLKEFHSSPDKNVLSDFLKYHLYNLGLVLMKNPRTAQKGIEYIECVVQILKGTGKQTNAHELLCNSIVQCLRRNGDGDAEAAACRLISMRSLGFSDQEVIATLTKATNGIDLPASLFHDAGCFYHVQAYEDDVTEPNGELLTHAEMMLKKSVELQPTSASHHVELSMFLYRNDRFDEAIEAAKQGITCSEASKVLKYLGYGRSEEITLDGNLGYHIQRNDTIKAPALIFAYYVLVACLEELRREDEALQFMNSYKTACGDPRKEVGEDDSLVLYNYSCLLLKLPGV
ncbi:Protein mab-21 [Stylophora pistillata]|uniref:Protein mab-21 n=1 Tax=Stylophora pistillata TaxID=50429 RepID=A0A2B4R8V1_STYPI|nr:Protein mab-21 [Stylophora pistillata]